MANPQFGIVMFENASRTTAMGQSKFASVDAAYASYRAHQGTSKPSLPDYVALSSGQYSGKGTFGGVPQGADAGSQGFAGTQANIFHQLASAGYSWKTYEEGVATAGYNVWSTASTSGYASSLLLSRHCPAQIYSNTLTAGASHGTGRYDFDELAHDITNQSLPDFFVVTPNAVHCGHDSGIGPANTWLSSGGSWSGIDNLIAGMRSGGLLALTFDNVPQTSNPSLGTGVVYLVICGPGVTHSATTTYSNHFSLLKAIQGFFGVSVFSTGVDSNYASASALVLPSGGGGGGGGGGGAAGPAIDDVFSRSVSNGWGTSSDGHTWTQLQGVSSQLSVTNGVGGQVQQVATDAPVIFATDISQQDYDVTMTYKFSALPTGGTQNITVCVRGTDAANYTRFTISQSVGGHAQLGIDRQIANVNTSLGTFDTGAPQAINTVYKARLQAIGTTVQGRVWLASQAEPSTWQISGTDNVASLVTGSPGVRLQATSGWTGGAVYTVTEFKGAVATGGGGGGGGGGGAITFRSATDSTNGTTSTAVTPSNAVAGDLMLAHVSAVGASAITAPAGWNQIATVHDSTAVSTSVFSKTASSSESSATFNCSGASGMRTVISYAIGGATIRTTQTNGSSGTAVVATTGSALTGLSVGDEVCTFITSNCGPRPWGDTGCVFGIMPNPSDWSTQTGIAAIESTVSRKLACAHSMVPWDCHAGASNGDFTSGSLAPTVDYNNNRLTYTSWPRPRPGANGSESSWQSVFGSTDPATVMGNIASGTYDGIIDGNANAYKAWGQTTGGVLIIRLFWEMNGGGVIFNIGKSASINTYLTNFLAAWKRIVTRTRAVASNVLFHWNPQNFQTTAISRDQLYPGDAYVDFAGTEYYMSPGDTFTSIQTNTTSNGHTYAAIYSGYGPGSTHNMLEGCGEGGCRLQASGDSDATVASRVTSISSGAPNYPGVKFYTWWNGNGPVGDSTIADQGTQTQAAIVSLIASSYFTPDLQSSWKPVGQSQVYESRRALGAAAKTNYGAGQVAATMAHTTQAAAGSSTALAATTWGYGKYAAITVALATGSVDSQAPTAPSTLTAAAASPTQINLAWHASTDNVGVTAYKVWETTGTRTLVATLSGATLTYSATVSASSTHSYVVTASDGAGNQSTDSNTASATTPAQADTSPPTAPGTLTATATQTTVNLSWTASTDNVAVTGYNVFRNAAKIATLAPATSYTDSTGAPGTSYAYTVSAFDGAGNTSALSNPATVTYPTPPSGGPTIRTSQRSTAAGATSITFSPPAGTQVGDLLYAVLTLSGNTPVSRTGWPGNGASTGTAASGFSLQDGVRAYNPNETTYTWTWPSAENVVLDVYAITGVDPTSFQTAVDNQVVGGLGTNPLTFPQITLANGADLLIATGGSSGTNSMTGTIGSKLQTLKSVSSPVTGLSVFTADLLNAPSGTNGPFLTSYSTTTVGMGILQAFKTGTPPVTNPGPTVSITSPTDGQTVTATSITVQAQTSDPDGISEVDVAVNGGSWTAMNASGVDANGNGTYTRTVSLSTSSAPGTANTIQVQSIDANTTPATTQTGTITVNAITPATDSTGPTFTWSSPPSGTDETIQGNTGFGFVIAGVCTDASGVNNISITNPDSTVTIVTPDQNGNFNADWNLATGTNAFTVVATDGSPAANQTTVNFTITLANPDVTDTTGPTLVIETPAGTQTVYGNPGTQYNVTGNAVDPSGIATVTVNGNAVTVDSDGDFTTNISLASGSNVVTVVATDASANSNQTSKSWTVTLAAVTGPTLTVTDPAPNLQVTADAPYIYQVDGIVSSSFGVASLTVNGTPIPVAGDGSWSLELTLEQGDSTLIFVATDTQHPVAGVTTVSRVITVNAPQAGTDAFNLSGDQARIAERIQERGLEQ